MIRDENYYSTELNSIKRDIDFFKEEGKSIFITSSFQSQSVPLLHMISLIDKTIPVIFIDTGFIFPETYQFRDTLEKKFSLNIINVRSLIGLNGQIDPENKLLLYASNPDRCCHINKVMPLQEEMRKYDVWITGVRRDQTEVRNQMDRESITAEDKTTYRPMLEWVKVDIDNYLDKYDLPRHPLEGQGYLSIGCAPCTIKSIENTRSNRWEGQSKTECGIHLPQQINL